MTSRVTPDPGSTRQAAASAIDASKIYGVDTEEVRALDGVSTTFYEAEFTAIMGPSGSGKSTLMHCMAGLDTLTSGQVLIDGADITSMNDKARTHLRRDKLGFIFQAFNLVPTLSARENIALPKRLAGDTVEKAWFDEVVQTVGLTNRLEHRPHQLSGGQQQRVAVARALAGQPRMIFADEPTGNLDSTTGDEILTFMRKAVDDLDQTIVMVTHDPYAAAYAHRVVFLADGKVVDEMIGPTAERVLDAMKRIGH